MPPYRGLGSDRYSGAESGLSGAPGENVRVVAQFGDVKGFACSLYLYEVYPRCPHEIERFVEGSSGRYHEQIVASEQIGVGPLVRHLESSQVRA